MIALEGKTHYLGDGFFVTRLLPDIARRSVGPFLFFDYFGPVAFAPGKGIDVRPHPHIGLATVTYLFEGSQMHRDTLGSVQEIKPGDVNWMTAGRGIAHSERTDPQTRAAGHKLHGIQTWVGLPTSDEEAEPHFQHFKSAELPELERHSIPAAPSPIPMNMKSAPPSSPKARSRSTAISIMPACCWCSTRTSRFPCSQKPPPG
jgi:redox-sensitive bicupin YhaK (pirin superfamily)